MPKNTSPSVLHACMYIIPATVTTELHVNRLGSGLMNGAVFKSASQHQGGATHTVLAEFKNQPAWHCSCHRYHQMTTTFSHDSLRFPGPSSSFVSLSPHVLDKSPDPRGDTHHHLLTPQTISLELSTLIAPVSQTQPLRCAVFVEIIVLKNTPQE